MYRSANLDNYLRYFFRWQRSMLPGVPFKELTAGPLDRQKMETAIGFSDFYCADDIRVYNAGAVLGFSYEARNSCSVEAELLS
jgi:hypothetical protein